MPSTQSSASSFAKHPPLTGKITQRGFSLFEMATVLFLVSLLLGGSLRGTELIGSGQVKGLTDDFQGVARLLNMYQDKYHAQPGDDLRAVAHLGAGAQVGDGDGVIDGRWHDAAASSEASRAWQHFRLAGLTTGAVDPAAADYAPLNALGHPIGLQNGSSDPVKSPIKNAQGAALAGTRIICSRGIPGKLALSLDIKLDDGNPASGSMLATPDTGAAYAPGAAAATVATNAATDIQRDQNYIVCMGV